MCRCTQLPLQRALKSGFRNRFVCCCHRRYILSTFQQPVRSNILRTGCFSFFFVSVVIPIFLFVFIVACGIVCTVLSHSLPSFMFMCLCHLIFYFYFCALCLWPRNIYSISFGKCSCSVSSIHLIHSILPIGLFQMRSPTEQVYTKHTLADRPTERQTRNMDIHNVHYAMILSIVVQ